jgi:hypothetical protein
MTVNYTAILYPLYLLSSFNKFLCQKCQLKVEMLIINLNCYRQLLTDILVFGLWVSIWVCRFEILNLFFFFFWLLRKRKKILKIPMKIRNSAENFYSFLIKENLMNKSRMEFFLLKNKCNINKISGFCLLIDITNWKDSFWRWRYKKKVLLIFITLEPALYVSFINIQSEVERH